MMKPQQGMRRSWAVQVLLGSILCLAPATKSVAASPGPIDARAASACLSRAPTSLQRNNAGTMPWTSPETTDRWRRQELLVPSTDPNVKMKTSLLLPPGAGPYRLAVINHGTTESGEL